jgi:hypothetical protein
VQCFYQVFTTKHYHVRYKMYIARHAMKYILKVWSNITFACHFKKRVLFNKTEGGENWLLMCLQKIDTTICFCCTLPIHLELISPLWPPSRGYYYCSVPNYSERLLGLEETRTRRHRCCRFSPCPGSRGRWGLPTWPYPGAWAHLHGSC